MQLVSFHSFFCLKNSKKLNRGPLSILPYFEKNTLIFNAKKKHNNNIAILDICHTFTV
jgi:hypothetical protein